MWVNLDIGAQEGLLDLNPPKWATEYPTSA